MTVKPQDQHEIELERIIAPWLGRVIAAALTAMMTFLAAHIGNGQQWDLTWVAGAGAFVGTLVAGFLASKIDWLWHKISGAGAVGGGGGAV